MICWASALRTLVLALLFYLPDCALTSWTKLRSADFARFGLPELRSESAERILLERLFAGPTPIA